MPSSVLFTVASLIWGSTFFAITLQLGEAPPAVSVAYRCFLATDMDALVMEDIMVVKDDAARAAGLAITSSRVAARVLRRAARITGEP